MSFDEYSQGGKTAEGGLHWVGQFSLDTICFWALHSAAKYQTFNVRIGDKGRTIHTEKGAVVPQQPKCKKKMKTVRLQLPFITTQNCWVEEDWPWPTIKKKPGPLTFYLFFYSPTFCFFFKFELCIFPQCEGWKANKHDLRCWGTMLTLVSPRKKLPNPGLFSFFPFPRTLSDLDQPINHSVESGRSPPNPLLGPRNFSAFGAMIMSVP